MRTFFLATLALVSLPGLAAAQFTSNLPAQAPVGLAQTQRWKVGVVVDAVGGPVMDLQATVPVPTDWPEQSVKISQEDVSPQIRLSYRATEEGLQQMIVSLPRLNSGERASALVTYEVTKSAIEPPANPEQLIIPRRMPLSIRKYLAASPGIDVRSSDIRDLARELTVEDQPAWQQVEAFYEWVRKNITVKQGSFKTNAQTLRDRAGDHEDLAALFIALCRASKIPARTVWVPDHSYAEFYLQDAQGEGHWLACQLVGARAFGSVPDTRPILQKGDNFRVPEKEEPLRYVAEHLKLKGVRGARGPRVEFVRELLPVETP